VDLGAVVANARLLASRAGCELFAVVKADAYGHGACAVAGALELAALQPPGFLYGLAVSLVEEGIELREAGIKLPILVMGPSLMDAHAQVVAYDLTPMVSDLRHLDPLAKEAGVLDKILGVHLKFDTGMGRLGILPDGLQGALDSVAKLPSLRLDGVASHLACADIDDPADVDSKSAVQLRRFEAIASQCRAQVASPLLFHVANSAAILRFPGVQYDLVRPGLALYGNGGDADDGLAQVIHLVSEISQVRHVAVGETVSYGAHWTAARPSTVAIVPLGYADGLPRNLNKDGAGRILIRGESCSIIGTVAMDMIVVDITDVAGAQIGDESVVLGCQGRQSIAVAEMAERCGISEYEVTCGISKRVPRRYVSQDG